MEKTIYLFRHGTPEEALQGRCRGGDTHCDLSPEGIAQTHANIEYLLSCHTENEVTAMQVVTSGMERSDYFGRKLADHGAHHSVQPDFRTIAAGDWESLSWDEIQQRWPDQLYNAVHRAEELVMPNGEPVSVFRDRVRAAFRQCLTLPTKHLVIVGHGCTNDVILAEAEERPGLRFRDQPIGCMNRIEVRADGKMMVTEKRTKKYQHADSVV